MLNEAKDTDQIGKTPFQLETYKTVAPESEGRFEITKFDKPYLGRRSDQKRFKSSQKVLNYIKPFIYNS